jgi:phage gpG-like protein
MRIATSVHIKSNAKEIKESLRAATLEKAAVAGGEVVRNYAKLNVRSTFSAKSKGVRGLAGSMTITTDKADDKSAEISIGPTKIYGRIQELGGIIKPVYAKMLSWVNDSGERVFARQVRIPARPYLRPAMDEHVGDICEAVREQIEIAIRNSASDINLRNL